jgi:signal transduction histidine kinase
MVTLETNKLFNRLAPAELGALSKAARQLSYSPGQQIFKEGDPGDGIYVVRTGRVQISALLDNGERHVFSQVTPGDFFGEMAVLDDQPRSATASADQPTTVHFIPRDEVLKLLRRCPEMGITLVQEISGRLREFNHQYIDKLLQTERMALVGRFASSIVHDLKNPLTVISMSAGLLCAGKSSEETRKAGEERINKQIDRITTLINEILEFTQGGGARPEMARTDYQTFVTGLLEEMRDELALSSISITCESPPPAIAVSLNPKRLGRVFYNLVGNAVDAMSGGGEIKVRFALTETEVITEIEDSGHGIAPEVLDHLFEAFVTFGKPRGTGLGLSITQKIIEEHHGKISARNRPGGGAIFSFTLPRSDANPAA